ncbi:glycerate kinase [Saccharicrinis sp. FJH54]|uniref:glycerate kinase n=1 Tax=Saccharicrinis sp. FJH54 TaxID=3344665 RepID=UPI0035D4F7E9
MNIVIAIDSFKDCLSSAGVAEHVAAGIRKVYPDALIHEIPIADGGEGTLDAMCLALHAEKIPVEVHDPLMRPVSAAFGWHEARKLAIVEMAMASGIERLTTNERNPLLTSTFGTGELIKAALDKGCREMILGIGGSATNDAGTGMAKALGAKLLNSSGRELLGGGGDLVNLNRMDLSGLDQRLKNVVIRVACDVSNTLTGQGGASAVFGPQKGATPEMVQQLDANLTHFAGIVKKDTGTDLLNLKGGGAAGGLGAGLYFFAGAELVPGFELISETVKLEDKIALADFVITGEGKIDGQTIHGKTPYGVSLLAQKYHKPVIAVAGQLGDGYRDLFSFGFGGIFTISDGRGSVEDSIRRAPELLESLGERIFRLIKTIQ